MNKTRRQLTLFVDEKAAEPIEEIRKEFNPDQYQLIKSHVTLCREDEIEEIEKVMQNLTELNHPCLAINFGRVVRFADGKGVLIPANGNNWQFQEVRRLVLQGINDNLRIQEPHVTLMHPRNSTCTDGLFEQIERATFPTRLEFRKISLIEQEEGKPWMVLKEFELKEYVNK